MKFIIRTYVKNEERLRLFEKSIISLKLAGINNITVIDDQSPLEKEVQNVCMENAIEKYVRTVGKSDTINGLYSSLKEINNDEFTILCVDDFICSSKILDTLKEIKDNDIPIIKDEYGTVGLFACYPSNIRIKYKNTNLWNIETKSLYALVCHHFSNELKDILINEYEEALEGRIEYPEVCDDIWVATICARENLKCFNTIEDYAFHTGMNNRTFGDSVVSDNSCYQTPCYVGN